MTMEEMNEFVNVESIEDVESAFPRNILNIIKDELEVMLRMVGVNTSIAIDIKKLYRGTPFIKMESITPIVVMPPMFQKVGVCADGSITTNGDCYKVHFNIRYTWVAFDCGFNGTHLGNVEFLVRRNMVTHGQLMLYSSVMR